MTEMPSMPSSERVATRMSPNAERARLRGRGAAERDAGAEQRPAGEEAACGPSAIPEKANTDPAWLK